MKTIQGSMRPLSAAAPMAKAGLTCSFQLFFSFSFSSLFSLISLWQGDYQIDKI